MKISLLIDGSIGKTQVGLMKDGVWMDFRRGDAEVLEELFVIVGGILEDNGLEMEMVDEYIYCEGPGSMLGIRISCMAINVWRGLFGGKRALAYNSLAIACKMVGEGRCVYLGSARGKYFVKSLGTDLFECGEEQLGELGDKVKLGDVYEVGRYDFKDGDLEEVEEVDAKLFKVTEYVKWDGERHRKGVDKEVKN